jgi:hypothetical protein
MTLMAQAVGMVDLAEFNENGFVVVDDVLDPHNDLDPIISEYSRVLDRLAHELHDQGAIESTYADLPFGRRAIEVFRASGSLHRQYFDFSLPEVVRADTPIWTGPAVFNVLRNERILDIIESMIGGEIYSNPIQHVRIKVPEHLAPRDEAGLPQESATPWHQDNGVQREEADDTEMITVWFPLLDAAVENGCLQVVPGSHRSGLLQHCPGHSGVQVPTRLFAADAALPLPIRRGSVIFMHRHTCHGSVPNVSDDVRWSFDLRYNPIGQPTGRGALPGFVARSRRDPASELRDPEAWTALWRDARDRIALAQATGETDRLKFYRWDATDPACA